MRPYTYLWGVAALALLLTDIFTDFWFGSPVLFWLAVTVLLGWAIRVGYVEFFDGSKEKFLDFLNGKMWETPPVEEVLPEPDMPLAEWPAGYALPVDVVDGVFRAVFDMAQKDIAAVRLIPDTAERHRLLVLNKERYEAACQGVLLLFQNAFPSLEGDAPFTIKLYDALPNLTAVVRELFEPFWQGRDAGPAFAAGYAVWNQYARNQDLLSLGLLSDAKYNNGERIAFRDYMNDYEATRQMAVAKYLAATPFSKTFMRDVPFSLPDNLRTEHTVIVARSGGGKSQLLEALILHDLNQPDPPSIIVIDSKAGAADLFQNLARLDVFHPDHGRLRDKLVLIDPKDEPPLNILDEERPTSKERKHDIIDNMRYFMREMLGNELSGQMDTIFDPVMQIVLNIKGATLRTFIDVLEHPEHPRFAEAVAALDPDTRGFIETRYNVPTYGPTKAAVASRIDRLLNNSIVGPMFKASRNVLNFAEAMNEGKVVLISTSKDYLKPVNSALVGRYFISRILSAAQQRSDLPREARKRVHVYIDECKPYTDDKLEEVFNTIRSYGVGMTVAYQDVGQMGGHMHGIMGSTRIRITGEIQHSDRVAMARHMETKPEFLAAQTVEDVPPGKDPRWANFAVFGRNPPGAQSVHLKFLQLQAAGLISPEDYERMKAINLANLRRDDEPDDEYEPLPPQPPSLSTRPPARRASLPVENKKTSSQPPDDPTSTSDAFFDNPR